MDNQTKLLFKCDKCGATFALLESTVMETEGHFTCRLCGAGRDHVHYEGYAHD